MEDRIINLQIFAEEGESGTGEGVGVEPGLMGEGKPATPSDWREKLPDDLKGHPSAQKFKTPEAALRSYIELEKTLGKDKIPIPGDNASPEEMESFFKKLGRPDDPSGYKVEMPEGVKLNEEAFEMYKGLAHKAGLTNAQFGRMVQTAFEMEKGLSEKAVADFNAQLEQDRKALQNDWGDKYNENVHKADLALEKSGVKDIWKWADERGVRNDPTFTRLMAHFGNNLSEDSGIRGGGSFGALTAVTAQSQLDVLMGDPAKKDAYLKGDKTLVKQITELNAIIYGNKPISD